MNSNLVGCCTGRSPGLAPLRNLIHVGRGASTLVVKAHRVGHQAADIHKLAMAPQRRYPTLGSEAHDGFLVFKGQNTWSPEKRVGALPGNRDKGALELAKFSHFKRLQCQAERRGRFLQSLQ